MNTTELIAERNRLHQTLIELKAGDYILDASIDTAKPGGTARGNVTLNYRLRVKGQKARYLRQENVDEIRSKVKTGQQIRKLEKRLERLNGRIDAIAQKAHKLLGL